jgi:hypothetical protein
MELVEVILQGVRGSPTLSRWVFPSSASVVAAGPREEFVARTAFELLSCAVDAALPAAVLSSAEGGAQARAGVVIVGRDQRRFRVLWDLTSGRRALQVQRGDAWEMLSSTTTEIAQLLTATIGVPQADALREVLFAFVDDLPSRRRTRVEASGPNRASRPASTPSSLPPGFSAAAAQLDWHERSDDDLRARLRTLLALAAAHDAVTALEFELGGMQRDAFDLDARIKPLAEGADQLAEMRARVARDDNLERIATEFPARVSEVRQGEANLARHLKQFDEDERRILDAARGLPADAYAKRRKLESIIAREKLVTHGLAAGFASIALAVVGSQFSESLRYLALLDIPAFGVAVVGGFRLLTLLEDGTAVRDRLERVADERTKEKERVAQERQRLDRLMIDAGFGPGKEDDVEELLQAHLERRTRLRHAEDQQRAAEERANLGDLRARREALAQRIRLMEQRLEVEGTKFDAQAAEHARERAEIEGILHMRGVPGGAARALGSGEGEAVSPEWAPVDVGQLVARAASDLLVTTLDDACAGLSSRTSQIVAALLGQRFNEVRFGPRGEMLLVDAVSREALPFGRLPAADRDLAIVALRLAVLEAAARKERMPLVVDRFLDHLLVEHMPLLVRALQFIGQSTQVICLTTRRELAGVGPLVTASAGG